MPEECQDTFVGSILLAQQGMAQPIFAVVTHECGALSGQQFILNHVLDFFHGHCPVQRLASFLHPANDKTDHRVRQSVRFHDFGIRRLNRPFDSCIVEWHFPAIPLYDFHNGSLLILFFAFMRPLPFPRAPHPAGRRRTFRSSACTGRPGWHRFPSARPRTDQ